MAKEKGKKGMEPAAFRTTESLAHWNQHPKVRGRHIYKLEYAFDWCGNLAT